MTTIDEREAVAIRTGTRLTWLCNVCAQPIKAGTGYLKADEPAAWRQLENTRELEQRMLAAQQEGMLLKLARDAYDPPLPWLAFHGACDSTPTINTYWIGIERLRSLCHVLDWTAHLMRKDWIGETDWDDLCRRVSGVDA